jgi:hypothetical protein
VVHSWPSSLRFLWGEQRLQPLPLRISQISSIHTQQYKDVNRVCKQTLVFANPSIRIPSAKDTHYRPPFCPSAVFRLGSEGLSLHALPQAYLSHGRAREPLIGEQMGFGLIDFMRCAPGRPRFAWGSRSLCLDPRWGRGHRSRHTCLREHDLPDLHWTSRPFPSGKRLLDDANTTFPLAARVSGLPFTL